jgi:periplasmic divalent cation tolerance protein
MGAEDSPRLPEIVEVVTSCDDQSVLGRIADALIHEHLAACVHVVGPTSSTYRWQGAVHRATEWRLVATTTRSCAAATVARIGDMHSHELPSIVIRSVDTTEAYGNWVCSEVTDSA